MDKKILLILIMGFAIFGVILAGTLTIAKYSDKVAVLCGENIEGSCNVVQNSDYSYLVNYQSDSGNIFQIPISMAGVLFYIMLFLFAFLAHKKYSKERKLGNFKYYLFGIGIVGIVFSIVYTWIQAYKIEAFCTYCLISAFDSLAIFILITVIAFTKDEVKNAVKNSSSRKTKK